VIASARATNEDAFGAMKLARAVLGTNNVDHCARVCHAPSIAGLSRTLGSGAMTNPIADIDRADCLLIIGARPRSPRLSRRAARRGGDAVYLCGHRYVNDRCVCSGGPSSRSPSSTVSPKLGMAASR
jgi:predicted molibdopterin-dependent oxidoreductase YjgC